MKCIGGLITINFNYARTSTEAIRTAEEFLSLKPVDKLVTMLNAGLKTAKHSAEQASVGAALASRFTLTLTGIDLHYLDYLEVRFLKLTRRFAGIQSKTSWGWFCTWTPSQFVGICRQSTIKSSLVLVSGGTLHAIEHMEQEQRTKLVIGSKFSRGGYKTARPKPVVMSFSKIPKQQCVVCTFYALHCRWQVASSRATA